MASYNRVILVGNLTRDPELRFTPNNTAVSDIGLAVNDRRKNASGEWVEIYGLYHDEYVRRDGRWLFASRAFRTLAHRVGANTRTPAVLREDPAPR